MRAFSDAIIILYLRRDDDFTVIHAWHLRTSLNNYLYVSYLAYVFWALSICDASHVTISGVLRIAGGRSNILFCVTPELPWKEASLGCQEYLLWKRREASYLSTTPWSKISTGVLGLLRKLLHPSPAQRLTVQQIKEHTWMNSQDATDLMHYKHKIPCKANAASGNE